MKRKVKIILIPMTIIAFLCIILEYGEIPVSAKNNNVFKQIKLYEYDEYEGWLTGKAKLLSTFKNEVDIKKIEKILLLNRQQCTDEDKLININKEYDYR